MAIRLEKNGLLTVTGRDHMWVNICAAVSGKSVDYVLKWIVNTAVKTAKEQLKISKRNKVLHKREIGL